MHKFLKFIFWNKTLHISDSYVLILLASCMTYTIAVCTVKKLPDDGQRNYPKHVEFYS